MRHTDDNITLKHFIGQCIVHLVLSRVEHDEHDDKHSELELIEPVNIIYYGDPISIGSIKVTNDDIMMLYEVGTTRLIYFWKELAGISVADLDLIWKAVGKTVMKKDSQ